MIEDSQIQQRGKDWLEQFFKLAGFPVQIQTDAIERPDGSCWLTIPAEALSAEQLSLLIGENGHVLDSIKYLINSTLNIGQPKDLQHAYTIELNHYRANRQLELQTMADEAVSQVRETGQEFEIAALSAAERRQVHTMLEGFEDLETYSRGQEPDRRLVVRLVEVS